MWNGQTKVTSNQSRGEDASSDSRGLRFDERERDANYMRWRRHCSQPRWQEDKEASAFGSHATSTFSCYEREKDANYIRWRRHCSATNQPLEQDDKEASAFESDAPRLFLGNKLLLTLVTLMYFWYQTIAHIGHIYTQTMRWCALQHAPGRWHCIGSRSFLCTIPSHTRQFS